MRLLLVEDNERFAGLLKRGLAASGFVVDVMPTAGGAAAALRANRLEVVVLDNQDFGCVHSRPFGGF